MPLFSRNKKNNDDKNKAKAEESVSSRSHTAGNPFVIFLNFVFMCLIFFIVIGALALYSVKTIYERPGSLQEEQTVLIPSGAGVNSIAQTLKDRGIISNKHIFIYGTYLKDKTKLLKAGEYAIPAHSSMQQIVDILIKGHNVQYSLTIPEGITVYQAIEKLKNEKLLTGDIPANLPTEGSLMADTIHFIRGTARSDLIRRLTSQQTQLVDEIWNERNRSIPLKNKNEMVVLASIVEKETGIASERPQIAAVFYNRLQKHMRLQSDPTVIYGVFGGKGKPADRPIYRSDLDSDNPYNTYKIFGLPPTPICIPGKSALQAVANPPDTKDLFFVADGTGGHIFSKTLSEHNENVAKWRKLKKAQ